MTDAAALIPGDGSFQQPDEVARGIAGLIASDQRSVSWSVRTMDSDSFNSRHDSESSGNVPEQIQRTIARYWREGAARGPISPRIMSRADGDIWSLHSELFRCVAALEKTMAAEGANLRLGLRNSNAPEPIARIPFDSKDRRAIDHAVAILKAQPPQPADPADALEAAGKLQAIGERICTHFTIHRDPNTVDGMKSDAPEPGQRLELFPSWGIFACNLIAVAGAARTWIGFTDSAHS